MSSPILLHLLKSGPRPRWPKHDFLCTVISLRFLIGFLIARESSEIHHAVRLFRTSFISPLNCDDKRYTLLVLWKNVSSFPSTA